MTPWLLLLLLRLVAGHDVAALLEQHGVHSSQSIPAASDASSEEGGGGGAPLAVMVAFEYPERQTGQVQTGVIEKRSNEARQRVWKTWVHESRLSGSVPEPPDKLERQTGQSPRPRSRACCSMWAQSTLDVSALRIIRLAATVESISAKRSSTALLSASIWSSSRSVRPLSRCSA